MCLQRPDFDKLPGELSGGMAQRVAIARAMSVNPRLVLMDEPFGALDAGLRRQRQDTLRGEVDKAGTTVLFVTHDVTEAVRLADRIIVLSGSPARGAADIESIPPDTQAGIYAGAAMLLRHRDIEHAFSSTVKVILGPPALLVDDLTHRYIESNIVYRAWLVCWRIDNG